jgi:hypothetical protein
VVLSAHSAYTFAETEESIKKAFTEIQHGEVLYKFINFTKAVEPLLNIAAQTQGQSHAPQSFCKPIFRTSN